LIGCESWKGIDGSGLTQDGNGQFELNWEYDDCLATADKHTFFKFMAKSVAEKHGEQQRLGIRLPCGVLSKPCNNYGAFDGFRVPSNVYAQAFRQQNGERCTLSCISMEPRRLKQPLP
jgi:hypothetical protein